MHKRVFIFMGIAIPIALIAFAVYSGINTAHKWFLFCNPSVATGVVISSEVRQRHTQHRVIFIPEVHYTYNVAGIQYTNNVSGLTKVSFLDCEDARAIVRRYPKDGAVPVYYCKDKPHCSMLESSHCFPYGSVGIDITLFFVGFCFLLITNKEKK